MITRRYIVTGTERRSTFYLKHDRLATGFIEKAEKFMSPDTAQQIADAENRSKVWSFPWKVEPYTIEIPVVNSGQCRHCGDEIWLPMGRALWQNSKNGSVCLKEKLGHMPKTKRSN